MDLGLKGKRALVVGASRSIGKAAALRLHAEGAIVTAVARSEMPDLSGLRTIQACVTANLSQQSIGFKDQDIFVYAVGGSMNKKDALSSARDWADVMELNFLAAIPIINNLIPGMIERKWGRIVMISSDAVRINTGGAPYTVAKWAVEGYVKKMGVELAPHGIVVSGVRPGNIYTPGRFLYSQDKDWTDKYMANFVPSKRWGTADEVANVIAFLASERASYMAGTIVDVSGRSR